MKKLIRATVQVEWYEYSATPAAKAFADLLRHIEAYCDDTDDPDSANSFVRSASFDAEVPGED